jgi:REP element-mobilizing transposase RayT
VLSDRGMVILNKLDRVEKSEQKGLMPRQARLNAPGTLHHLMVHGIEGSEIFKGKNDRMDFLDRFASLCEKEDLIAYAWALMSNHVLC